jgi:NCS1 family nucleobase:cation symporter-1
MGQIVAGVSIFLIINYNNHSS